MTRPPVRLKSISRAVWPASFDACPPFNIDSVCDRDLNESRGGFTRSLAGWLANFGKCLSSACIGCSYLARYIRYD